MFHSSKRSQQKNYFRKCFLEILEDRVLLSNTYVVDLAGDIRYCINQADQKANAGSTITFDANFLQSNKTITLRNGELKIAQSTTITGPVAADMADAPGGR